MVVVVECVRNRAATTLTLSLHLQRRARGAFAAPLSTNPATSPKRARPAHLQALYCRVRYMMVVTLELRQNRPVYAGDKGVADHLCQKNRGLRLTRERLYEQVACL